MTTLPPRKRKKKFSLSFQRRGFHWPAEHSGTLPEHTGRSENRFSPLTQAPRHG